MTLLNIRLFVASTPRILAASLLGLMLLAAPLALWEQAAAKSPATNENALTYLIIPFIDLDAGDQHLFLTRIMPHLTLDGALTNTGTNDLPWYCIAYPSAHIARDKVRLIQEVYRASDIAAKAMIEGHCAAG